MKANQTLKIVFVILLIILISLISFGGIFIQKTKFVENIIPSYRLGMDLTGSRLLELEVSDTVNTIIYDKDGKVVDKEGEGTTKKEEPVNPKETLTKENYQKAKEVFEARLAEMQVEDYNLRFDESNGKAYIRVPENDNTDTIAQYTAIKGVFKVENEDGEELLNNGHLKQAKVVSRSTSTGVIVALSIEFNKEGKEILKDITNTYVTATDEDGKDTSKKVSLKIDDSTILSTSFEEEISNGIIQLSIGQATTSNSDYAQYVKEASSLAVLLNTDALPLTYTIERNTYIQSDITEDMFFIPMIVVVALVAVGVLFLIIRYGKNGFLTAISFIGYMAVLLLAVRYFNVIITLEGMVGILIAMALNYIFSVYLLHVLKGKEGEETSGFKAAMLKALFVLVPVAIIAVILSFTELWTMAKWQPISSFGMTIFWGILISVIYNLIFTRCLVTKKSGK